MAMTGGTLAAAALPIGTDTDVSTNGTYLYVFNQQNGSDISQSPWYEGTWATMDLVGKRDLQDWSVHDIDVVAQLPRSRGMSSRIVSTGQDVFGKWEHQRGVGRFRSVLDSLCRRLSGWQRPGIWR